MKRLTGWGLALAVALVFLAPLLWMIRGAFLPEDRVFLPGTFEHLSAFTLENFRQAWERAALGRALVVSFLQVAGVLGIGLWLNSMAAFAFARLEFRGRDTLFAAVVALIILPVEVLVIPLFLTARDFGMTGGFGATLAALVVPFSAKAMNIFFLRQAFMSNPRSLEEAALMDGAGWFQVYARVALPSIRPALATVVVLDVITHWSDFLWPLVVCTREETRTVQIALANLFTRPPVQWGDILACAVLMTLPVLFMFRLAQRHLVLSEHDAAEKG